MRTDELLQQARFALETNRPADAAQLARAVLDKNAGQRDASRILGLSLLMLDRAEDAVAPLEKAARGSHDAQLETLCAMALQRSGRGEEALAWLARAVKRKPPHPMAFFEYGQALAPLHRYDEAIDVLRRGLEIAPMHADMAVLLANVYSAANDRKNAADCFRRALSINPGHAVAMEGLAVVLMQERDFAQAAELFRGLLRLDPSLASARIGLGNCLLNLGDKDQALESFRMASARGPQFFGKALRVMASSGKGRFWLRPSDAAKALKS